MSGGRPERRDIDGVFLLDKCSGYTSNSSLQRVKRLYSARKAGHTGSLDPLASGLLPICLGEATKFSSFLLNSDKRYQVRIRLGVETDTADSEGAATVTRAVPPLSAPLIEHVLSRFRGEGTQVPPMYSALKQQGRRLYDLARQGVEVERPARPITIFSLRLLDFTAATIDLDVHCSKGTYVRTLAEDIGRELGCGGHVERLRRTGVGSLDITSACTIERLESIPGTNRDDLLLPVDGLVAQLPLVTLNDAMAALVRQGNPLFVPQAPTAGWVRLYGRTAGFLGLGEVLDDGRIGPRRMLRQGPA